MFFQGSRYLNVKEYTVSDDEGRPHKVKRARPLSEASGTFRYQVKQGDRLDLLAQRFYRTPRKWWLISDANPRFMDPLELLTPGEQIIIPKDRLA